MSKYIITFRDDIKSVEEAAAVFSQAQLNKRVELSLPAGSLPDDAATDDTDVQVVTYLENVNIAIAELSEAEINTLNALKEVVAVEPDSDVEVLGHLTFSLTAAKRVSNFLWNINMVRANAVWAAGRYGAGVKVAVLDTGIASHANLQTYGGVSYVSGEPSFRDEHGHGTHCAGIIAGKGRNDVYGVAFGAELYAVKVLGKNGTGSRSDIIKGMDWCITNGINVISMSLGGRYSPTTDYIQAVKRCQMSGATVVCAAGNSYNTSFPWVNAPANSYSSGDAFASPIAVASVDNFKRIASSSSRGTNSSNWNGITVSAPGVSIYSTYLNQGYAFLSGTSMACPHVAGLVALILETNPDTSPIITKAWITSTAEQLGSQPYPNETFGHGLIDCAAATGVITRATSEEAVPA